MTDTLTTILETTRTRIAEIDEVISRHEEAMRNLAALRDEKSKLERAIAHLLPKKPRAKRGAALELVTEVMGELGSEATRAQVIEAAQTKADLLKTPISVDALQRAYNALLKTTLESVPH